MNDLILVLAMMLALQMVCASILTASMAAIKALEARRTLVFVTLLQHFAYLSLLKLRKPRRARRMFALPRSYHWVRHWATCNDDDLRNLPDADTWTKFHGMSPSSFVKLHEVVAPLIEKEITFRGMPIHTRVRLMCTLRFMRGETAFGCNQLYDVGLTTVYDIIHDTCAAIVDALLARIVRLPETVPQCLAVMKGFHSRGGFPNVISAIDCTHVSIRCPPNVKTGDFLDREGNQSAVFQCCVDFRYVFTHIYGLFPGSRHDSYILKQSQLWEDAEAGNLVPPGLQYCFLGDAGYPLCTWLITPFTARSAEHDDEDVLTYNFLLSSARMFVEQVFGCVKSKWRVLDYKICFESTDDIRNFVYACCIMWNWYRLDKLGVLQSWLDGEPDWGRVQPHEVAMVCRNLDARAQRYERQAGEEHDEKRRRLALVDIVARNA